jgi:hypothetical protein
MPTASVPEVRLSHDDDEAMTFVQWCSRNQFSRATGQRILKSGDGPELVQFSDRRFGITYGADRAWNARRIRPASAA